MNRAKKLRIPLEELPSQLEKNGSFGPGGYVCRRCGFRTERGGFSGKQALRGHLRAHAYFRRAWQRPLLHQAIATAIGCSLVGAGLSGLVVVPSATALRIPQWSLNLLAAGEGLSVSLALVISLFSDPVPPRGGMACLGLGRVAALVGLGLEIALAMRLLPLDVAWWPHSISWLGALFGLWIAPVQGMCRHTLAHRKRRSPQYQELVTPKDDDTDWSVREWLWERVRRLRQAKARQAKGSASGQGR